MGPDHVLKPAFGERFSAVAPGERRDGALSGLWLAVG